MSSLWVMRSSRHECRRVLGLSQNSFVEMGTWELEARPKEGCPGALPEPSARRAELPWVLAWVFEVSVGCALRGGGSEAASSARENLAWAFVQPWSQGLSEKAARHCTACKLQP